MRRALAWRILTLALIVSLLVPACDSDTKEKEEIIETAVSYTVSIGNVDYTLSEDLSTLTGNGQSYSVSDLEVTIDGVGYTLSSSDDGSYTATAKATSSDDTSTESDDDSEILSYTDSVCYSGALGDLIYTTSFKLSGFTVKASTDGTVTAVSADGVTYILTLSDEDSSYITERTYEGVLGDILYTEYLDSKGGLYSSYKLDGYTIDEDAMTAEGSDGIVYTLSLYDNAYSTSLTYKAASGAYNLGKVIATDGETVLVKDETKTLVDNAFEYTVSSTTYIVTLDDSTLTYSTEKASYIVYSGILGDLAVTSTSNSSIAEFIDTDYDLDSTSYKVEDGEFTVIVTDENIVTTYTIALGSDTYTAVEEERVTTYEGDLGDIYITETFGSSTTEFNSESSSYVIEATDEDGVLTVTTTDGSITYTVTLGDGEYEVETDYEIATYDNDLGSITVTVTKDGKTVVFDGEVYSLGADEDTFTYITEESNKTTTYEITIEDDGYSYEVISTVETYSGTFGIITVTDSTDATIPGESDVYTVSAGTIAYTVESGNVETVYTIKLKSDYTYTAAVDKTVTTYTGTFGTLTATAEDGVTTALFEGDDTEYTVESNTFLYSVAEDEDTCTTYTITLKTSTYNTTEYSYSTSYDGIFGAITISKVFGSTTATVLEISSNVYTVSATDNDFELTVSKNDGSASYQVTLSADTNSYSYDGSVVNSVTFVASSSSVDFGEITVLFEEGTATETKVNGSPDGFTENTDGTLQIVTEESNVTTDYTITLGEYDYSTSNGYYYYYTQVDKAVTVNEYTRSSYSLGTITTTETVIYDSDGNVSSDVITAELGSESGMTVTDNTLSYTDSYTYAITLSGSTYTYTYTDVLTYSGALSSLVETRSYTVATTQSYTSAYAMSGYTVSSDGLTVTKSSISYTLTLNTSALTYSYTAVYSAASGSYDLGTYSVTIDSTGSVSEYSNSKSLGIYSGSFSLSSSFKVESTPVVYTVQLASSTLTYSTSIYQTTYSYGSGESIGDIVVIGSSATIGGSGSYTVSSNEITQQYKSTDGAVLYNITLDTSLYTYATAVYSTTYTASSSSVNVGDIVVYESGTVTINGSGSYTVSSSVISVYTYNTYYQYNITLDDSSHVYTTALYATLYTVDSSSTGYGTVYVYASGTATVNGTSGLTVSGSTIYYPASVTQGVQYIITLNSSTHAYTRTVYQTMYTGTSFGTIIVNSSSQVISVNGTSLSSTITVSSNAFKYTSGSFVYTITLNTSSYTYTSTVYSTTYTEVSNSAGKTYGLGDIVVISSTSKASIGGSGSYSVSSSKITYTPSTYTNTTYTITLNTSAYTYTASKKVTYYYTNSYYGTITRIDTDGTSSYTKATDSTYSSTLYDSTHIAVGYVRFTITYSSVSDSGGTGTYTATEMSYISSLLQGYGEYKFYIKYKSMFSCVYYLGISSTEVGMSYESETNMSAYFGVDGKTIYFTDSSYGTGTIVFSSTTTATLTYPSRKLFSHSLEGDTLKFSTSSFSGSSKASTGGLYYLFSGSNNISVSACGRISTTYSANGNY